LKKYVNACLWSNTNRRFAPRALAFSKSSRSQLTGACPSLPTGSVLMTAKWLPAKSNEKLSCAWLVWIASGPPIAGALNGQAVRPWQ
jgi:hypothetical protein